MTNYSLWIVLPEEVKKVLNSLIAELVEKYESVIFEPHITLLDDIKCESEKIATLKAKKLALRIKKLNLEFGETSFSTTYFQNVFVRIKSTADLMAANLEAKKEFGSENKFFMPHISLLYGDHSMAIREKITREIKLPKMKFISTKIAVISSDMRPSEMKNPKNWNFLGEIKLS